MGAARMALRVCGTTCKRGIGGIEPDRGNGRMMIKSNQ
jgi:hypothetical protein